MANKGILATAGLPAVPGVCFERAFAVFKRLC